MKYIVVSMIVILLVCCNNSNEKPEIANSEFSKGYWGQDYYISGMHYAVQSNANFGVVINITKDSLEVAYYRQQLK